MADLIHETMVSGVVPKILYSFTLESFRITDTRSVHNDTDFVAVSVKVGDNAPITLPTKSMGDVNNGVHKVGLVIPSLNESMQNPGGRHAAADRVLSALVPASIAGSMKDEIFQAACNTLRTVAVRRRKWNLR
jgi:hypothetical protein